MVSLFSARAAAHPDRPALVVVEPGTGTMESVTYGELAARAAAIAGGLRRAGLCDQARVLLAGPLSVDFYALALALVGSGGVVVLLDGAMSRTRLLRALRTARVAAIVGSAPLLRRWWMIPPLWRVRRYAVGGRPHGTRPFGELVGPATELRDGAPDRVANISFTSGSSGHAKGAVRTNAIVAAQVRALAAELPARDGDVDMTAFPAAVFPNLCTGVTTVIPPVNLREPASIDPVAVLASMQAHGVTTVSAAPAFARRLAVHIHATGTRPRSVRRVSVGGAPVSRSLCHLVVSAFPDAETMVVYGSTEAEPVAHVSMAEVVDSAGDGLLVGRPVDAADVALVELPRSIDGPLAQSALEATHRGVGEVIVRGAHVGRDYVGDPDALATNKICTEDGTVWHRLGDVARRDKRGRLWLLGPRGGTVVHRGTDVHPFVVEERIRGIPGVQDAAFVAHRAAPEGELAVVLDDERAVTGIGAVLRELRLDVPIRRLGALPVDARHNSKIDRPALAQQLEAMVHRAVGGRGDVVHVVGPPGIGKSRTAREAAALAADRGVEVVRGLLRIPRP